MFLRQKIDHSTGDHASTYHSIKGINYVLSFFKATIFMFEQI